MMATIILVLILACLLFGRETVGYMVLGGLLGIVTLIVILYFVFTRWG